MQEEKSICKYIYLQISSVFEKKQFDRFSDL